MEIKCFVCGDMYDNPQLYFAHVKQYKIPLNATYNCTISDCYQKFYNFSSLKRHIKKHFETCREGAQNDKTEKTPIFLQDNVDCDQNFNVDTLPITYPKLFHYNNNIHNIYDSVTKFIVKLHSIGNFSRSDVNNIRQFVEDLILFPVLNFIDQCQNPDNYCEKTLSDVISDLKLLFEQVNSDFKVKKTLKEKSLIGDVNSFTINGNPKSNSIIMPLEFQFKRIFERNDYLDLVLNHMHTIESNSKFVNFIQGKLWKQKKSLYPNKITIPYMLYADDFGINNALGSKAINHSMCNFYYSFPCLPHISSKLDDVYLASTIKSSDVKIYGNQCFQELVKTIQKLEYEGIEIQSKTGIKRVYFIMGLLLGDNLGLNVNLGFAKSFSSHYYCRFCLIKKSEAQKEYSENESISRNRINYNEAIERNLKSETGISCVCIFNDIRSFHCTENFAVDIMHDLFEGVCHSVLCESILYFINTMKYTTLESLNVRLKTIKYEGLDKGNEKPKITLFELENHKLKMSAKQMMSFCQYFTIILGHCIPTTDQVWAFILIFFEMLEDILCYEVSELLIKQIRKKVEYVNKNYPILFKKNLTPKFHFLLHYTTVITQCGPLRNLWSFKYEAKHRDFKIYSHVITSRRNIPKSFSFKQQANFANFLLDNDTPEHTLFKKQYLDENTQIQISRLLKIPVENFDMYLEAHIWGYQYTTQKIISRFTTDFELFKICAIVKTKLNDIYFYCQQISIVFSAHYLAFEHGTVTQNIFLVNILDIVGPPVESIETPEGKTFVKLKEFYKSIY